MRELKAAIEVQKAHDIIHAVALREVDLGLTEEVRQKFHVAHDVLSWVLNGPCGYAFEAILNQTMLAAKERGYSLERLQ